MVEEFFQATAGAQAALAMCGLGTRTGAHTAGRGRLRLRSGWGSPPSAEQTLQPVGKHVAAPQQP
jgi:hypothetical protein